MTAPALACQECGEPLKEADDPCPVCDAVDAPKSTSAALSVVGNPTPETNDDGDKFHLGRERTSKSEDLKGAAEPPKPPRDDTPLNDDSSLNDDSGSSEGAIPDNGAAVDPTPEKVVPIDLRGGEDSKPQLSPVVPDAPGTDDERFFRELASIQQDKLFAILFLGFREAGKTWLLHRIKEQLFSRDATNCEPAFKRVKARQGQREELPSTSRIEFHRVLSAPAFVLIDIPGEMTRDLVEAKYSELRPLLAAMNYAKALIVALPTDLMVFGPLMPDEDDDLLAAAAGDGTLSATQENEVRNWAEQIREGSDTIDDFTHGLFRVAGILSYLQHHRIDPANVEEFAKVSAEAVTEHISRPGERRSVGGKDGLDCPTFFSLTKADRIMPLFGEISDPIMTMRNQEIRNRPQTRVFEWLARQAGYYTTGALPLGDPWLAVRKVRQNLHTQMINYFPLAKFDYATAFYGHDGKTSLTRDHYDKHPQHGVYEVLQWISHARSLGRRPRLLRLPYALAAKARRYMAGIPSPRNLTFWRPGDPR